MTDQPNYYTPEGRRKLFEQRIKDLKALIFSAQWIADRLKDNITPSDESERDLLDAAYDVFEIHALWDQAREYGERQES